MTILLWWWGIGAVSCFLAALWLNWRHMDFNDFLLITVASIVLGIAGPLLTALIAYWFWSGWRSQFAVDEDGRILYPWRD